MLLDLLFYFILGLINLLSQNLLFYAQFYGLTSFFFFFFNTLFNVQKKHTHPHIVLHTHTHTHT